MKAQTRRIALVIAVVIIVSAIFYLQSITSKTISGVQEELVVPEKSDAGTDAAQVQRMQEKERKYKHAIELVSPDGYINTDPFQLKELVGKKVILLDFWTYSCINCQRTLPYLNAWYEKYKDKGFVIIGVHSPEFDFEKEYDNVQRATEKFGVKYPVILDNNHQTWSAYKNQYWPREYIIDIDGFIVHSHIGEGDYDETEKVIQELLEERSHVLQTQDVISKEETKPNIEEADFAQIGTSEIYLGYAFQRGQLGNKEGWQAEKEVIYNIPGDQQENKVYLEGTWYNHKDNMELVSETGKIMLTYVAKNVYMVAGAAQPVEVTVKVDNKETKKVMISKFDLYTLVDAATYGKHTLEIDTPKGMMAYTFTFG